MSVRWLPFQYRDYYDIPRLLAFSHGGRWYMLDCPFNDDIDDYGAEFRILRLRDADVAALSRPGWREIMARAEFLGVVPVADVEFDPTRRQSIGDSIVAALGPECR